MNSVSGIPTEKEQKYDRQLRLWGSTGQQRLEQGCVCLLNASACGTETLKNLVLPNIGSFIVVDGSAVTATDCGSNFFVSTADIDKRKAEVTCRWICELNPDVKGRYLDQDPIEVIQKNPGYFSENGVTVVVATQLEERYLIDLSKRLVSDNISLVSIRSYGLIGFVRVQGPSRGVVENFPDAITEDLRILDPFPSLLEFCQSVGSPDMTEDSMLHAHIPYPVLLMDAVEAYKAKYGSPGTEFGYEERKVLQKILEGKRRKTTEDNFKEAISSVHKINTPAIPAELRAIMSHSNVEHILSISDIDEFWICVAALAKFHQEFGKLPLNGQLKDLTATTQWFVGLQAAYQTQAAKDREIMAEICNAINNRRSENGYRPVSVPQEFLSLFLKNVWAIRYYNARPIFQELEKPNTSTLIKGLESEDQGLTWYILLRAGDRFINQNGSMPGDGEGSEEDVLILHRLAGEVLQECNIKTHVSQLIPLDFCTEWNRFGGAEVHCVSAVLGGVGAQEVIKLITGQRFPLNHTFIYDGIKGSFHTYEL